MARDQVAQIITFGTLQARGVLATSAVCCRCRTGRFDKLCKLLPQNPRAPSRLGNPSRASRSCRLNATPIRWSSVLQHRAKARRLDAPRSPPTPPHRHRRPGVDRIGAALPRSEIRHAGHPVQHENGWSRRAW